MAELYKAKITGVRGFEKIVAIKTILPHLTGEDSLVLSFIDEAKIAALLQHPNIVQIYDFGKINGNYFIAMEYLSGQDLKCLLKRANAINLPLSLKHSLSIAAQVCAGLEYAHNLKDLHGKPLKVIHRDIGPQNIFVTYDGQVKIIDFGIAKTAMQNTATKVGSIKGKLAYMSPEQARGEMIDQRADLFAIGNTLYEMATGRRMFNGDEFQVYAKVREAEFEPPETVNSSLPASLYTILKHALTKNPEDRYCSANQMLTDLNKCMADISGQADARSLSGYMQALFKEEVSSEDIATPALCSPAEFGAEPAESKKYRATGTLNLEKRHQQSRRNNYSGICALALLILGISLALVAIKRPGHKIYNIKHEQSEYNSVYNSDAKTNALPDKQKVIMLGNAALSKSKALNKKALALLESNPEKAKKLLIRSLSLNNENAEGYNILGRVYFKQKKYPEAVLAYKKAIGIDPGMAKALFNIGLLYTKKKEYVKAEKFYTEAIELTPPFLDEALCNLAYVQEQLGKLSASKLNLEKAVELDTRHKDDAKKYLEKINRLISFSAHNQAEK